MIVKWAVGVKKEVIVKETMRPNTPRYLSLSHKADAYPALLVPPATQKVFEKLLAHFPQRCCD